MIYALVNECIASERERSLGEATCKELSLNLAGGGLPTSRAGDCSPCVIQASREEFLIHFVVGFRHAKLCVGCLCRGVFSLNV